MSRIITLDQIMIGSIVKLRTPISVVRDLTGITYRKINDWERKDYLIPDRSSKKTWRQFLAEEVFGLQVFNWLAIRKFGASNLKWLMEKIKSKKLLQKALSLYFQGLKVFFVSDLENKIDIVSQKELQILIEKMEEHEGFQQLCLNGYLKDLLVVLASASAPLKEELVSFLSSGNNKDDDFFRRLLEAIKSGKYSEIKIKRKGEGHKIKGKRIIQENASEEVAKQMKLGGKIVTHVDKKNGKITTAEIEEDLN